VSTATDTPRVIVALDFSDAAAAEHLVDRLDPTLCRIKVGKELFTGAGPALVSRLVSRGFNVFLDLKFHDIPNTVARACAAAADLGVWMLNVHALGGRKMMEAAREALADRTEARPLLIGVTILTSLGEEDIREVGLQGTPADNVVRLADLAKTAGLDGVVCSPLETTSLRHHLGTDFLLVTPGVRPAGAALGDQRRVLTPAEAIERGADYLVIGRPVTQAADPLESLRQINANLAHLTG
jgi:orotidine-5'-phosphate decarboxylase